MRPRNSSNTRSFVEAAPELEEQMTGSITGNGTQAEEIELNAGAVLIYVSCDSDVDYAQLLLKMHDANGEYIGYVGTMNCPCDSSSVLQARYTGTYYLAIDSTPGTDWEIRWE